MRRKAFAVHSRGRWKTGAVDMSFAVCAQAVAVWFLWAYSRVVVLRLPDDVYLATVHKIFIGNWYLALIAPVFTAVLSASLLWMNRTTGLRILCQLSWLLALSLVCFVIVAWEFAYLPVIRLSD